MLAQRRALKLHGREIERTPLLVPSFSSKGFPDVRNIIHDKTLYKFIAKIATAAPVVLAPADATLQDLLVDTELGLLLSTFVIVPSSYTLADPKKKMDEMPNCRDAFVTLTGKPTEPIIGWLTDARLAEFAKV